MFTRAFWMDTLERAVKTFAQVLAGVGIADGTGMVATGFGAVLSTAAIAATLSVVTSLVSGPAGFAGTASATRAVTTAPRGVPGGPDNGVPPVR